MAEPLRIEIVSDVICPWCLIGTRRLDLALASRPDVAVDVVYRPFLLDPQTPPEGADLRERLRRKYGDPEPLFRRVESVARADGIDLDFKRIGRTVSTVRAHTVLRHAIAKRSQRALARALFGAYFLEGRDVSDLEVLESLATSHGFAAGEARDLSLDPAEEAITREEAREASRRGVSGVPHVFFGKGGATFGPGPGGEGGTSIAGAQPVEAFVKALDAASAR